MPILSSPRAEFTLEHKVCPLLESQRVSWTYLTVSLKFILLSLFNGNCHFDRLAYDFHPAYSANGVTYYFVHLAVITENTKVLTSFSPNHSGRNSVWLTTLDDVYLINSTNFPFKI